MKRYFYSVKSLAIVFLLGFISCSQENETIEPTGEQALRISPAVGELADAETKAANNFFKVGDEIRVTILDSNGQEVEIPYTYDADGIFSGNPGYQFPLDDSYIENLTAVWPSDAEPDGVFEADQRDIDNYRRADWLVAKASASGIMATNTPVPLFF
ncbi:MAG: fimbrillin family protein [Tannerellaceae bacterium]|nr:fimbrillin family protein [Tannerellaceae bacterium]